MKQIVFRIKNNGEIISETVGMKGKECLKYVNEMERLANAVTQDSRFTDEYLEQQNRITGDYKEEVNA